MTRVHCDSQPGTSVLPSGRHTGLAPNGHGTKPDRLTMASDISVTISTEANSPETRMIAHWAVTDEGQTRIVQRGNNEIIDKESLRQQDHGTW